MQDGEWQEAWLAAERAEAMEAAVEALDAPEAWRPLDAGWDSMDLDLSGASSRCADGLCSCKHSRTLECGNSIEARSSL